MMVEGKIRAIQEAIEDFLKMSGSERDELMVVMGPGLFNELNEAYEKMFPFRRRKENGRPRTIAGVEIEVRDRIKDDFFGIFHKDCKDHLDEHLDEVMDDDVEWIQCDLCKHPMNIKLADGDDLKCLWCGDVNDLEDIFGKGDE